MSSVSLGVGLAREGKKVLLVDVDAQGSMTASLGYQHPDRMEVTLATVLGAVITDSPLPEGGVPAILPAPELRSPIRLCSSARGRFRICRCCSYVSGLSP